MYLRSDYGTAREVAALGLSMGLITKNYLQNQRITNANSERIQYINSLNDRFCKELKI